MRAGAPRALLLPGQAHLRQYLGESERWEFAAVSEADDVDQRLAEELTMELKAWTFDPVRPEEAAQPQARAPRTTKRMAAHVGEATAELAAVAAYRRMLQKGIRPSLRQAVKLMRAAGAKGRDAALRAAFQAVLDDPAEHGI